MDTNDAGLSRGDPGPVEIKPSGWWGEDVLEADYFTWSGVSQTATNLEVEDLTSAKEYFLLLPLIKNSEAQESHFYLLTSEWRELIRRPNGKYSLSLAEIPDGVYRNNR